MMAQDGQPVFFARGAARVPPKLPRQIHEPGNAHLLGKMCAVSKTTHRPNTRAMALARLSPIKEVARLSLFVLFAAPWALAYESFGLVSERTPSSRTCGGSPMIRGPAPTIR